MSGAKVLAQVAESVTAENFGDAVIYANSSATVYGVVTINDQPAEAGDVVGFYVGTELRFKGTVVISGGTAYVTGLMNAAGGDETFTFKVYDDSAKLVYPVPGISLTVGPGSTTGPSPFFEVKASGSAPADTTAPVITLTGSASVSHELGATYTDAGATADGGETVTTSGTVNVNTAGVYTLTYSASDAAANAATSVTRTVTVADTTVPVITLTGLASVSHELGATYTDAGATADGGETVTTSGTVNVNTAGVYTLTYSASDATGNAATSVTRTVTVAAAQVAAAVTAENFGDAVIYANSSATVYGVVTINDQPAEAGDVVGFYVGTELRFKGTVVISGGTAYVTGLMNAAGGDETFTFKVYDDSAKLVYPVPSISLTVAPGSTTGPSPFFEIKASGSAPVVADTTAPVITLTGSASVSHELGATYTDAGATADGGETVTTSGTVSENTAGVYTLTYSASDAAGNAAASVTRTVTVADTNVPVITLTGSASVSLELGATYTDAGATSDGGENVTTTGAVVANTAGVYTLTYSASDAAGNAATSVTRTVTVADTIAPVITLSGSATVTHELGTAYTDAGATADSGETVTTAGTVNVNTLGANTLTYSVTDASGNAAASVTRTVTVTDTTAPVITLSGSATVTHELGATYADAGATADSGETVTTTGTVNVNTLGANALTYSVTDASGNVATDVTRTVTVTDTTAPVITLTGTATVTHEFTATYTDAGATADSGETVTTTGTVDVNTLGANTLTYGVTDASGNAAAAVTRTVTVTDTVAPTIPTVTSLNPTADTTPVLSGASEAGSTVKLYAGLTEVSKTLLGSVVANSSGAYSFTSPALSLGSHDITATATDASGNASAASSPLTLQVVALTVTANSPTNDTTPLFSGVAVAGLTVDLNTQSTFLGSATADSTGEFTFQTTTAFAEGEYSITATSDPTGTGSGAVTSSPFSLNIDLTAPDAPSITGTMATRDTTPTFIGSAESGSTVKVYSGSNEIIYNSTSAYSYYYDAVGIEVGDEIDFALSLRLMTDFDFEYWSDVEASEYATGVIRIYANDGDDYPGTGGTLAASKVPSTLLYTSAAMRLESGLHSVVIDNLAIVVPDKVTWTFEVTTDDSVNAGVLFSADPETGASFNDFWVKNTGNWDLNVAGGISDPSKNNFRAKVYAYNYGFLIGQTTAGSNGSFTFTPSTPFSSANHSVTATATDPAGNTGVNGKPFNFEVGDNYAPVATDQSDNVTTSVSKNINLGVTDNDGDTVQVKITSSPSHGSIGGVIYNASHSANLYEAYFKTGTEFGDEIDLGAGGRRLGEFSFEVYAETNSAPANATVTLKIYANDGDTLAGVGVSGAGGAGYGALQPNTLLYKSDAKTLANGFQTVRVSDINVDLPEKATWTVQFGGVTGTETDTNNRAALILGGNNVAGTSLDDFWMKDGSTWGIYRTGGSQPATQTDNFAANVIAYDANSIIVKYTPTSGYTGSDSFTYEAIDGSGASDTATVSVTVADNAIPDARDQIETVTTDISKNITLNVTDNDWDAVEVKITTSPAHGSIGGAIYNASHDVNLYEAYFKTGTEFGDEIDLGTGGRRLGEFSFEVYAEFSEEIYNSQSSYKYYLDALGVEVGDEIDFGGASRVLKTFDFEYWSNIATGQSATGVIRFYKNDDTSDDGIDAGKYGASKPSTLLYTSIPITIANGFNTTVIDGLSLTVPDKITWSFEVTSSDSLNAGVVFSAKPTTGSSLDDFWVNTGGNWELNRAPGLDGNTPAGYDNQTPNVDPSKNNFGAKIFGYTAPAAATATLKIYANDGDSLGGFDSGDYGANEPGTLLYKSATKTLVEGLSDRSWCQISMLIYLIR